jgi:hypothetical protein
MNLSMCLMFYLWFHASTMMSMRSVLFWDITQCREVKDYHLTLCNIPQEHRSRLMCYLFELLHCSFKDLLDAAWFLSLYLVDQHENFHPQLMHWYWRKFFMTISYTTFHKILLSLHKFENEQDEQMSRKKTNDCKTTNGTHVMCS